MNKEIAVKGSISKLPISKKLNINYKLDVQQFNRYIQDKQVNLESLPDIISDYFRELEASGKRPATLARAKAAIKKAVELMAGGIDIDLNVKRRIEDHFRSIKTGKPDISVMENKILSKAELKELIAVSGVKTGLIIQALYQTACRVSELVNVQIKDCRISGAGVTIRILGKGKKEGLVYMTKDLFDNLKKAYKVNKNRPYLIGGHRPLSRLTVHRLIKRAGVHIGRPDIHPHTLRHSWASLSIEGLGLSKTSAYLRHSNLTTTTRFYLHGKPEMADILSVNRINQI